MSPQKKVLLKQKQLRAKTLKKLMVDGLSLKRAEKMLNMAQEPQLALKTKAWISRARKAIRAELWKSGREPAVHTFVESSLLLFIDEAIRRTDDQIRMQRLYESEGVPPLPTKDSEVLYRMLCVAEIVLR